MSDYDMMLLILKKTVKNNEEPDFYTRETANFKYIVIPVSDEWYDCTIEFDKKGNIIRL